jgi:hypothetical protein
VKKILKALFRIAQAAAYIGASAFLVMKYPPIAMAFMATWVASKVKGEYERVVVSALMGVLAAFLVLNFAELAIAATVLPVADIVSSWADCVQAA